MQVRVLLFAQLREMAGARELCVEVGAGATAGEVRAAVGRERPALAGLLANCGLALNEAYVAEETPVRAGDVLALIPPVSGGER